MTPTQRDYLAVCRASHRASERRRELPPGSSRALVTTANARWSRAAESRDSLAAALTPAERAEVDAKIEREARL